MITREQLDAVDRSLALLVRIKTQENISRAARCGYTPAMEDSWPADRIITIRYDEDVVQWRSVTRGHEYCISEDMIAEILSPFTAEPSVEVRTVPMKKLRILSPHNNSQGMQELRQALEARGVDVKRLRTTGSTFTPTEAHRVLQWGYMQETPSWYDATGVINRQQAVRLAANKLRTFEHLKNKPGMGQVLLDYTTDAEQARQWLAAGDTLYCRGTLTGHSGDGIVVVRPPETLNEEYPLYTRGMEVKHEYRVHVVLGKTLIQRKARRDVTIPHADVRNHENYHFVNDFSNHPTLNRLLEVLADRAVHLLGLDIGAVDIAVSTLGDVKILEVNTTPGLSAPTTLAFYADTICDTLAGPAI